jgi:hypothetical protein
LGGTECWNLTSSSRAIFTLSGRQYEDGEGRYRAARLGLRSITAAAGEDAKALNRPPANRTCFNRVKGEKKEPNLEFQVRGKVHP